MRFSDNWLLFFVLLLLPDISMIGYTVNNKLGAMAYNFVHNFALGVALLVVGIYLNEDYLSMAALILIAHVGMDRFLGFGLKYESDFKKTHIQKA